MFLQKPTLRVPVVETNLRQRNLHHRQHGYAKSFYGFSMTPTQEGGNAIVGADATDTKSQPK
jgi:hypothetical protein